MSGSLWGDASGAVDGAARQVEDLRLRHAESALIIESEAELRRAVDAWARLVGRESFRRMTDPWRRGISRDDVEQVAAEAAIRAVAIHPGEGLLSSYTFAAASNAAKDLYTRSEVLDLSVMSDDVDEVDAVWDTFDNAGRLLGEAFDRLVAGNDAKAQRALAAAWDLANERERITVASIAARSDLTTGEARLAWDRIKALLASMMNPEV